MTNVIIRPVEGAEKEIGLGVIASTPPHIVVAWGEYADQGEADGEVRVIAAVDENGNDVSSRVAEVIANAVAAAISEGRI